MENEETLVLSEANFKGEVQGKNIVYLKTEKLERQYYNRLVKKEHGQKKYRLKKKIISGGMSTIFEVLDQDLQRTSAMKMLLPSMKNDHDTISSFIAEAKITGLLEHPNIVPVHEIGLLKKAGIYFTMKLARGNSLDKIIAKIKLNDPNYLEEYTPFKLLNIFRKICDAVSFAHSRQIVHQDIKPHNIMIGHHGEVLLMDWGLAGFIGDPDIEEDTARRETLKDIVRFSKNNNGRIKGSPAYISPEQVRGDISLIDKRSDIFLLGSTLYHLFTLYPPYQGKDVYEVLTSAENRDMILPEVKNPEREVPDEICQIIMKAMAYRKSDRYQNVEEMAADIDELMSGRWSRQNKKWFAEGDYIIKEGETGNEAYMIVSGQVKVIKNAKDKPVLLSVLGKGDIVGEMSLISREVRSASVKAMEKTQVAVLTKDVMSRNLAHMPPYIEKIISTVSQRLRVANTRINPHLSKDCTYVVLQQLRLMFKDHPRFRKRNFSISYYAVKSKISEALGISERHVEKVLDKAERLNLIIIKDMEIEVPDMYDLAGFTDLTKTMERKNLKKGRHFPTPPGFLPT
ncbi:protein kinase [Desulfobacterales bacterium HSG16]|nr:protein kinase [Desulfobacterales bacterium HSG16]